MAAKVTLKSIVSIPAGRVFRMLPLALSAVAAVALVTACAGKKGNSTRVLSTQAQLDLESKLKQAFGGSYDRTAPENVELASRVEGLSAFSIPKEPVSQTPEYMVRFKALVRANGSADEAGVIDSAAIMDRESRVNGKLFNDPSVMDTEVAKRFTTQSVCLRSDCSQVAVRLLECDAKGDLNVQQAPAVEALKQDPKLELNCKGTLRQFAAILGRTNPNANRSEPSFGQGKVARAKGSVARSEVAKAPPMDVNAPLKLAWAASEVAQPNAAAKLVSFEEAIDARVVKGKAIRGGVATPEKVPPAKEETRDGAAPGSGSGGAPEAPKDQPGKEPIVEEQITPNDPSMVETTTAGAPEVPAAGEAAAKPKPVPPTADPGRSSNN